MLNLLQNPSFKRFEPTLRWAQGCVNHFWLKSGAQIHRILPDHLLHSPTIPLVVISVTLWRQFWIPFEYSFLYPWISCQFCFSPQVIILGPELMDSRTYTKILYKNVYLLEKDKTWWIFFLTGKNVCLSKPSILSRQELVPFLLLFQ